MPDLMTHLAATHLLRRAWERTRGSDFVPRQYASLYLGGCLPDLVSRMPGVVTGFLCTSGYISLDTAAKCGSIWECFHAPLPTTIVAYLLAMLLPETSRAYHFLLIVVACALHYFMDALQTTLGDMGEAWLFPFSWKTWNLGLFWPDESILALPWLGCLVVVLELFRRRRFQLKCSRT